MKIGTWLTSRLGLRKPRGRELQESLDIRRALALVSVRRGGADAPKDLAAGDFEGWPLEKQRDVLAEDLLRQLAQLFETTAQVPTDAAALAAEARERQAAGRGGRGGGFQADLGVDPNSFPVGGARSMLREGAGRYTAGAAWLDPRLDSIRDRLGFCVRPGPSGAGGGEAAAAGLGAWLDGEASAGSVVGLYPGVVLLPGHLSRTEGAVEALYPDEHFHLFARYDGTLIDARGATPPPLGAPEEAARRERHASRRGGKVVPPRASPSHPFGVAHLCNHPPRGARPNAMLLAVDFPAGFGAQAKAKIFSNELLPLVPNVYVSAPSLLKGTYVPGVAMQGACLVATRPLKDEEVFVDYRLSPNITDRPSWYVPVDDDEEARRWTKP